MMNLRSCVMAATVRLDFDKVRLPFDCDLTSNNSRTGVEPRPIGVEQNEETSSKIMRRFYAFLRKPAD